MDGDYEEIIVVAGAVLVALLGLCCKGFYKLKISELSFCGSALRVRRDVEDEIKRDIQQSPTGDEESGKTRDEIPNSNRLV
jgi:hypothetical protein